MKKYTLFLLVSVFIFSFFVINKSFASTTVSNINNTTALDGLFKRELAVGSKGEDVQVLQKILKDAGYLSGKADGSYGSMTKKALMKYQKDNGLKQTGKTDKNTFNKIKVMAWPKLCKFINENNGSEVDYVCPTE